MKQVFLALTVILFLTPLANAQTNTKNVRSATADDQEILRLVDVLNKAWLKNDTATVSSIVADDFQSWSHKGAPRNKADLLRTVAQSEESETKTEEPIVRVYGDAAIYTARIIDSGKRANGEAFTVRTCVTTVFVRRAGKWRIVADHETLLP